jgi:hypothetical protein
MEQPPKRIEVYDNSHISGTNPYGAMIVAGPEGFMKNQYASSPFAAWCQTATAGRAAATAMPRTKRSHRRCRARAAGDRRISDQG